MPLILSRLMLGSPRLFAARCYYFCYAPLRLIPRRLLRRHAGHDVFAIRRFRRFHFHYATPSRHTMIIC